MKNWLKRIREKSEKGAIIVEATIALPVFIFAILIILSITDICYVQSKMAVAVNSAAKEMSQYGYLYTTFELENHLSGEGGKSSEFMDSFGQVLNKVSEKAGVVSDELGVLFKQGGDVASGDSLAELGKNAVGGVLAKKLVQKNLVAYKEDTADAFLRRNQVVNGLDGLSFLHTSFLTNAEQNEVDIVVSYEVRVLKLLNTDFNFRFIQRGKSKVWGKGVSLASKDSGGSNSTKEETNVWQMGPTDRGKAIVASEKKNYTYISDRNQFHAYNSSKNEFVRIVSNEAKSKEGVRTLLQSSYSSMYSGVANVGTSITLKDASGKDVVVNTPEEGRVYKIVLVVPDDADMNMVNEVARAYEQERAALGDTVTVEVKTGYGNKNQPKPDTGADEVKET